MSGFADRITELEQQRDLIIKAQPLYAGLRKNLKEYMEAKHLNVGTLASLLDLQWSEVSRFIQGERVVCSARVLNPLGQRIGATAEVKAILETMPEIKQFFLPLIFLEPRHVNFYFDLRIAAIKSRLRNEAFAQRFHNSGKIMTLLQNHSGVMHSLVKSGEFEKNEQEFRDQVWLKPLTEPLPLQARPKEAGVAPLGNASLSDALGQLILLAVINLEVLITQALSLANDDLKAAIREEVANELQRAQGVIEQLLLKHPDQEELRRNRKRLNELLGRLPQSMKNKSQKGT